MDKEKTLKSRKITAIDPELKKMFEYCQQFIKGDIKPEEFYWSCFPFIEYYVTQIVESPSNAEHKLRTELYQEHIKQLLANITVEGGQKKAHLIALIGTVAIEALSTDLPNNQHALIKWRQEGIEYDDPVVTLVRRDISWMCVLVGMHHPFMDCDPERSKYNCGECDITRISTADRLRSVLWYSGLDNKWIPKVFSWCPEGYHAVSSPVPPVWDINDYHEVEDN